VNHELASRVAPYWQEQAEWFTKQLSYTQWLSMRKKVGELFQDWHPKFSIGTISCARMNFNEARGDAVTLLKIHDQATGGKSGRPKPELEALKRSALILAVTAWESFVEDTVT
jgi:hypothetical protein